MRRPKSPIVFMILALLTVVALIVGVVVGTSDLPLDVVLRGLAGEGDPVLVAVVRAVRFPRAILALEVGAALAVAGVLMQALFRNVLAAPDLLGSSAGASTGAILAITTGLAARSSAYLPLLAALGAGLALAVVVRLARGAGRLDATTLLLGGVAMTAFLGALNSALLAEALDEWEVSRAITLWMLGGLTDRGWVHVWLLTPGLVLGVAVALWHRRDLDLLSEADDVAASLGVDVATVRTRLLAAAAILTGSAVAVSGLIGFVGLVVPHALRLVLGPAHPRLVPASALLGGAFLALMDVVARVLVRPSELQLGVVTAFVGAPVFAWLLLRQRVAVAG